MHLTCPRRLGAAFATLHLFPPPSADDDDFFSSDEESGPADTDNRSLASYGTTTSTQRRFRINIKSVGEEQQRSTGGADASALRAATQSLRLGGLLLQSGSIGAGSMDSTPATSARLPSPGSFGRIPSSEVGPRAGTVARRLSMKTVWTGAGAASSGAGRRQAPGSGWVMPLLSPSWCLLLRYAPSRLPLARRPAGSQESRRPPSQSAKGALNR